MGTGKLPDEMFVAFCYVNRYKLRLYGPFSMSTDNLTFTWLLF